MKEKKLSGHDHHLPPPLSLLLLPLPLHLLHLRCCLFHLHPSWTFQSTSPTAPIMVLDLSSATTSLLLSSSLPPSLPTLSAPMLIVAITTMPPLTLPVAFPKYMQGIPINISKVIMNPTVQALMAQIVVILPFPPQPIEPPKMEATM